MAARPVFSALVALRPALAGAPVRALATKPFQRPISTFKPLYADTPSQPQANPLVQSMAQSASPSGQTDDDGKHAAFLGEADSDDGFEAWKDAHGQPPGPIDADNAAFLGEADSDDGFESHKDIHGEKIVQVDASQAAFLGEADSDDGFESDVEINPEKHRHIIEDASGSGEHGQPGEGDQ